MTNILTKPYTNEQYAQFSTEANQNGQRIEILDDKVFALYSHEKLENDEIIDISDTPEYKAEQELKEKERIGNLYLTPRDFLIALMGFGVKFSDVEALLAQNEQARLELNYCQYVYRGSPLLDALCGVFGLSSEQLDEIFEK